MLPLVAFSTPEAYRLRRWTEQTLDSDEAHIIDTLTPLEVLSTLRRLEANREMETAWATEVQRRSFGWPYVRERMTQPRLERSWELRQNFTPYGAAYLAITESLQSEHRGDVALLTADTTLKNAPVATLPCQILSFPSA